MDCGFVVFDLETTGLSSRFDEIIQIAAARLGPGGVVTEEVFATFVRPEASIPSFITGLTGISNRDVAHAPPVAEALATFSQFVGDAVLIAHNGHRFDAKFLTAACEQKRLNSRPVALIDSITSRNGSSARRVEPATDSTPSSPARRSRSSKAAGTMPAAMCPLSHRPSSACGVS